MKLIKFIFLVILLMGNPAYAIDYKSVSVERGDKETIWNSDSEEAKEFLQLSTEEKKQWVVVHNHNSHPVQVNFQYILGHKDAPWKSYLDKNGEFLKMKPNSESIICLGGNIKGLRIIYVDVDKSASTKKALNAIGNAATGLGDLIKTEENN